MSPHRRRRHLPAQGLRAYVRGPGKYHQKVHALCRNHHDDRLFLARYPANHRAPAVGRAASSAIFNKNDCPPVRSQYLLPPSGVNFSAACKCAEGLDGFERVLKWTGFGTVDSWPKLLLNPMRQIVTWIP